MEAHAKREHLHFDRRAVVVVAEQEVAGREVSVDERLGQRPPAHLCQLVQAPANEAALLGVQQVPDLPGQRDQVVD